MNSAHPFSECATIAQASGKLNALLRDAGVDEHEADTRRLVCAAFGIAHIDLVLRPDVKADGVMLSRLAEYTSRRLNREPVTRILGARGFWSLDLAVQPNVLDPRPDTEVLVEACLDALGPRAKEPLTILDIGTGSGAIIAALLSECPRAQGWAVDVSPDAVSAAGQNLSRLGLADRVTVLHQSWSESLPCRFDLVASNPPYIETAAIAGLDPEVRNFDPALALDGGPDGLDAYREIAGRMPVWLKDDGVLAVEIGSGQAKPVRAIFEAVGARFLQLRQDYAGNDRAMVWTAGLV
ncbi:MAG: peptide chain release factor N(5)-glutamine methyltransferase [Beijerinckiaceae bacterium]